MFEIPSQYVTDVEKINYLSTTSYRLETDIDITFYNASNCAQYFMGIGDTENPFKGIFNGNGKNINIAGCNVGTSTNYTSLGFFGNTENALIKNCNIKVNGNVPIKYNLKTISFGMLAGKINNSTIYNNTISLNNTVLGINYPEGTKYYNSTFLSTLIGTASGNSKIEKCIVNMNNNYELCIKHNNDELTQQYIIGGIVSRTEGTTDERINITNCSINLENSKMYGIVPDYGLIGGAVGNAKYTDIYNTKVYLKNSEIGMEAIQNANKTSSYVSLGAGGIVGVDMGPAHKNLISIENCSFIGNNNSTIELKVIEGTANNKNIFMGGISGQSTYIMKDCNVEGVNLEYVGAHNQVSRSAVGKITGYSASDRVGFWASTIYFTPDETRGLINCTPSGNVNISINGSDTSLILVGDAYGLRE